MPDFKVGQQVRYTNFGGGVAGEIKHIEDNVAMVRFGYQDNRMIKLTDLIDATPAVAKPEPFKPGWYRVRYKPAQNFIYYVAEASPDGSQLIYTMAYNPKTGEMDASFDTVSVLVPRLLIGSQPGDLIRMKFVEE